ncbi:hypothetical protein [Piscinibacter sp. XHJ-5]|uniref:hypothetical protein n=1 Tax=Piscinibacter sp. XHJ-5 TaxID=3037797 RepID=UPI002452E5E2|nr:hypothetical protein [Piscinibacter sp. XHJ-5]
MRSPLLRGVLRGSSPLWLWAGQFAFCYGWVAAACHAGLSGAWVRGPLLAASALALVALSWQLVRACRTRREGLLAVVSAVSALLAAIGIAWSLVPVFLLTTTCRFG